MIAVLYADPCGVYAGLPGVDLWDEARDARLYAGPWPVVAHPPCARWCRLAGFVEATHGYRRGDDGGCFAAALAAVRQWGGVLEHPAFTGAWAAHGLPNHIPGGGWQRDTCGGWSCHVEQWHYGHPAKKATWLYAVGCELPDLVWSTTPDTATTAYVTDGGGRIKRGRVLPARVSWCGNDTVPDDKRRRLSAKEASATPPAFRDMLLSMAASVPRGRA